jgi:glutathione S-transferase
MLELYHHGTAVCAAKARLVLMEKGLDYTGHYIDILNNEQFSPEYLKINPKGVVPTLVHDGKIIRESAVIGEYIDEVFPDPPLKPKSAFDRASMRIWSKRLDEELLMEIGVVTFAISHRHAVIAHGPAAMERWINQGPPENRAFRQRRLEQGIDNPETHQSLRVCDRFLADMETQLTQTTWLAGEAFSLADTNVVPFVNRLNMLQLSGLWTESRPHLAEWWRRVMARPSFFPALMSYVPPELMALMKARGDEAWPKVHDVLRRNRRTQ